MLKDRVEAKNERIVDLNKQLMDSRAEAEGQCVYTCVLACVYGWDLFSVVHCHHPYRVPVNAVV